MINPLGNTNQKRCSGTVLTNKLVAFSYPHGHGYGGKKFKNTISAHVCQLGTRVIILLISTLGLEKSLFQRNSPTPEQKTRETAVL